MVVAQVGGEKVKGLGEQKGTDSEGLPQSAYSNSVFRVSGWSRGVSRPPPAEFYSPKFSAPRGHERQARTKPRQA